MTTIDETGPWDAAAFDTTGALGPGVERSGRKGDQRSVDRDARPQDRRAYLRRHQRGVHESQRGWDAPPYSKGARRGRDTRRAADGAEDGVALVDSHV